MSKVDSNTCHKRIYKPVNYYRVAVAPILSLQDRHESTTKWFPTTEQKGGSQANEHMPPKHVSYNETTDTIRPSYWSEQTTNLSAFWNRIRLKINTVFPCPRSRLRILSRETGLAVPSRVSLLILYTQPESGIYRPDTFNMPTSCQYEYK